MSKSAIPSEERLAQAYDRCISNTLIKSGFGFCIGVGLSFLLFKRKTWVVGLSTGIGLGTAYSDCVQYVLDNSSDFNK